METLGLTFLGTLVNYFAPFRAGVGAKAVYLKRRKNLSFARFAALRAAYSFLFLLMCGATGLVLLAVFWQETGTQSPGLAAICLVVMGVSAAPFVFRRRSVERQGRIWEALRRAVDGFETIKAHRRKLLLVCGSLLLQYVVSALVTVVVYEALGYRITLTVAMIIGVFTALSNFFTITPSNLGVQEVITAQLFTITGMDFTSGLLGAGLMRALHALLTFSVGPILVYPVFKSGDLRASVDNRN